MTDSSARSNRPGSPVPYSIEHLTSAEVEALFAGRRAVVLPLGGLEPWGRSGACGVASACVLALAEAVSAALELPCAPCINYGCSTPFKAFAGTAGVSSRTLARVVAESIGCWALQGAAGVVVIDGLAANAEAVAQAFARVKSRHAGLRCLHLAWQNLAEVRAFAAQRVAGREFLRAEFAVLSMAAYLAPDLVRVSPELESLVRLPEEKILRSWHKRGQDPQQFRTRFPFGSASEIAHRFDPAAGRELFDLTAGLLIRATREFLERADA